MRVVDLTRVPGAAGASPPDDGRRPVVLLVEDSPADVDLTCEALASTGRVGRVCVVRDGAAALAFLRREGAFAGAPIPDLVLLDLNLPGLDGRGVLAEIGRDPALRRVPVVMLSSSAAPDDVAGAYAAGANGYVTKPVGWEQYLAAVRAIEHFWLSLASRPERP